MHNGDYDVLVAGSHAPVERCAGALAARGLRVAVVERELIGGEWSYLACIPPKSLLRSRGILAAAPVLVRPPDANPALTSS